MNTHNWIFIAPHLDDVALSCGGLVWDLTQAGDSVSVWTLMAGFPSDEDFSPFAQENHATWGVSGREAILARRAEDLAACAVMGAHARHFDWLDAIYRRLPKSDLWVVNNNDELFSNPPEVNLVDEIVDVLREEISSGTQLVFPIGLGGHVDHQMVVEVGRRIGQPVLYYADYPYIINHFDDPAFQLGGWKRIPHPLKHDALDAWCDTVLCYSSQLGVFWRDEAETRLALRSYLAGGGGRLWERGIEDQASR